MPEPPRVDGRGDQCLAVRAGSVLPPVDQSRAASEYLSDAVVTLSGQCDGQAGISYGQFVSSLEVTLIEPVRNVDLNGCVEQLASLRAPDITARLQSVIGQTYWSFPCFPACRSVSSRR